MQFIQQCSCVARCCDVGLHVRKRIFWGVAYLCSCYCCLQVPYTCVCSAFRGAVIGSPAMPYWVRWQNILWFGALLKSVPQGGFKAVSKNEAPQGHALCVPLGGPIFGRRFGPPFCDRHFDTLRNHELCQPSKHRLQHVDCVHLTFHREHIRMF